MGKLALDAGLVDELKTRDQVRELLIAKGAKDEKEKTFRQIELDDYMVHVNARALGLGQPQVAVVVAQGEILYGDQPSGTVGGDSTSKLIRKAREDDKVKALVLRVDSPGGGVFPSELVRREIELTKAAGKPVVASMGDLAASGGYWISMNADEIVADPSTITGSIGIFGLWFNFPQTMAKLGLHTDGSGTTWLAGAFDPTRAFDPRVGQVIQSVIDHGYQEFIGKVADARGKTPGEVDEVARGRVWTGAQAKERGLVDTLGTLDDAIASAAKRANLGEQFKLRYVEKEMSPFESLMVNASRSTLAGLVQQLGMGVPASILPAATAADLVGAKRLLEQARSAKPVALFAHCQCGLD
jgi:protease-4